MTTKGDSVMTNLKEMVNRYEELECQLDQLVKTAHSSDGCPIEQEQQYEKIWNEMDNIATMLEETA